MRKNIICFFLIMTILSLGISCQKEKRHKEKATKQITQSEEKSPQGLKGRLQRGKKKSAQVVGRGIGQRTGAGKGARSWGPEDVIVLSEDEKHAIEIETIKASLKPLRSQLQVMGKVFAHPRRKAIVSYAFPARISRIHILIGDWVKTGQQLVTLQSEEVGTAKSEYYKAMADFELAQVNFERQKRLFDRGVGAQKDYLSSEAEYKVAQANLNAAEKKLHVLGFTEEQVKTIAETHQINPVITLYAPINGKIIENKAVIGAMVDQETEILIIMDPILLVIDAEICEKDIAKIRIGQEVEVLVPAYPGEKFMGKISYISDVLNEETRTITVRTEVENKDYKLKPGMFADMKIFLNHQSKALVLPAQAILDEKDDKMVFIKAAGKYYPQLVEVGAREGNYIEIIRGIREGDVIVTKGNFQLKSKLYEEILKKGHVH